MYVQCFLETKFANIQLISLDFVTWVWWLVTSIYNDIDKSGRFL